MQLQDICTAWISWFKK